MAAGKRDSLQNKAKSKELTAKEKKQLTEEEKEYKSKRKLVQEKLIKFATRIPAFMYLADFRENTLHNTLRRTSKWKSGINKPPLRPLFRRASRR